MIIDYSIFLTEIEAEKVEGVDESLPCLALSGARMDAR
jgi:hypothetical protein